jgi:1-acyl-sn-glycerol-3-phosphate acyltransferase
VNNKNKATESLSNAEKGRLHSLLIAPFYGVYAWLVFIVCAFGALLCACCLPGLHRRRRWVTQFARLPFRLAFIPTRINGLPHLPVTHSVVVANHASYLDGVILQAFLPPRFSYVIKGEMRRIPVAHFLLRRIGAHFVERHSAGASARDARTLLRAAGNGESLAFFPEGTFTSASGLGAFRSGAFAAAIRAQVPVVPIVIRGARQILPAHRMLPRRATLTIDVLAALPPETFSNSKALAETARQHMLAVLDEPDLLLENQPT